MGSTVLAPLPTHGPRHTLLIFPGSHTDSGLVHLCVVTAVNKFKLCFTSCHLLQTATPWLLLGHRGFVPQENGPRKDLKTGLGPFGERILDYSEHDLGEGSGFRQAGPFAPHLAEMGMAVGGWEWGPLESRLTATSSNDSLLPFIFCWYKVEGWKWGGEVVGG